MTDSPVLMSFEEAASALGTVPLFPAVPRSPAPPYGGAGFSSVCIDSRELLPGALFIALRGEREDGHRYAASAFEKGAAAVLVSQEAFETDAYGLAVAAEKAGGVLLPVEDTLAGFQRLAAVYLEKFPSLIRVGITGSSGKTTTKEIAAAMIGAEKAVAVNPGNLNSETGLPLAVFGVRSHHEVGVFEMGMNRPGEIAELARVLKPSIALITNVGSAHIGILGTKGAIAEEKKSIFSYLSETGTALIPADDEYAEFLAEGCRGRAVFYGADSLAEYGGSKTLGLEGSELIWEGVPVRFALPGRHNIANALAAAAIAREIPVSGEAVRQGLRAVRPLFGRGELVPGTVTVIRDCYNANPEAVMEAIEFCDGVEWPGRKIYVIGSMMELGALSVEAHRRMGRRLRASRADRVFLFGSETEDALGMMLEGAGAEKSGTEKPGAEQAESWEGRVYFTDDMETLSAMIAGYVREGDLVLLKGSRGMALERLMDVLTGTGEKIMQRGAE